MNTKSPIETLIHQVADFRYELGGKDHAKVLAKMNKTLATLNALCKASNEAETNPDCPSYPEFTLDGCIDWVEMFAEGSDFMRSIKEEFGL